MELLKSLTGTDMLHVPYKGSGPVTIDLLSGQIHATSASASSQLPHIKSGKLRALAVTGPTRSKVLPDVPTLAECGYPEATAVSWYGLHAPVGTPPAVVEKLAEALRAVTEDEEVLARLSAVGAEAAYLDLFAEGQLIKNNSVLGS